VSRTLPSTLTERQIVDVYRRLLDARTAILIDAFRTLLARPRTKEVERATMAVFPDEYGDGFVNVGLSFAGSAVRTASDDATIFAGAHVSLGEGVERLPFIDVGAYHDRDIPLANMVVDLIKGWCAECWWKAGGYDYDIPVILVGHDGFGDGEIIPLTEKRFTAPS
jgi:hypothetical protein